MNTLRSTQRAPQSCISCSRRKVRCNKKTPCDVCIRRGTSRTCSREKVHIKLKTKRSPSASEGTVQPRAVTEDMTVETANRTVLETVPLAQSQSQPPPPPPLPAVDEDLEAFERLLFERTGRDKSARSTVVSEFDVEFPSEALSMQLVRQGDSTNWAHCALHYPTFAAEHAAFWRSCANARERAMYDPFWLALYFSCLSVILIFRNESDELEDVDFMGSSSATRLQKWYDAALFYLHRADFLRNPDLRTVQAAAMLTVVFMNVGDFNLYQVVIPIAVRTAQILKLDRESEIAKKVVVEQEVIRRAWWTLVICEWLPVPFHPPCIHEGDFDVRFPSVVDDDELGGTGRPQPQDYPRAVQYHVAMIKAAILYHRFRTKLRSGMLDQAGLVDLVLRTDEELAYVIANMPAYLCAMPTVSSSSSSSLSSSASPDPPWSADFDYERFPWIPTQRVTLGIFLLNLRITINKTLQNIWSDHDVLFRRTRSICLRSAEAVISLAAGHDVLQRWPCTWASVAHPFSAAVILAIEAQTTGEMEEEQSMAIAQCLDLLRSAQKGNRVAAAALSILETIVDRV